MTIPVSLYYHEINLCNDYHHLYLIISPIIIITIIHHQSKILLNSKGAKRDHIFYVKPSKLSHVPQFCKLERDVAISYCSF